MFAFPNSNGSRGKPGTSVTAGRYWRHSRASRPGPATLHTSTNQVATVLAHKCDITTLSNYLESNPLIFLGFFGPGRLGLQAPARPSPSSSSLFSCPIVERSLQTRQPLRSTKKLRSHSYYRFFRRSCEPAELASRAASNPWKKTALLGAERTTSLEENSISGCKANKIPGKKNTFGCRANKILGVAVSYS